jgi:hypothetical protein
MISATLTQGVEAATITGKVIDTTNHPIESAIVTISEGAVSKTTPLTFHGASTQTAADGTFSFTNLDAGTYLLCSQVPHGTLIDPCQWTKSPPLAIVASATATATIMLTMNPGYLLPIRVNDPQNLLSANEGKPPGAHLLIGVSGGYHFDEALVDSADSAGRNVSLLVPLGAPIAVTVQSNFFKLQDGSGNALSRTNAIPVAASATPTSGFTVQVVGKN